MRNNISASLLHRLQNLESERCLSKQAVMMLPALVPVDQWGSLASRMQKILKDNITKPIAPDYGDLPKLELVECY